MQKDHTYPLLSTCPPTPANLPGPLTTPATRNSQPPRFRLHTPWFLEWQPYAPVVWLLFLLDPYLHLCVFLGASDKKEVWDLQTSVPATKQMFNGVTCPEPNLNL